MERFEVTKTICFLVAESSLLIELFDEIKKNKKVYRHELKFKIDLLIEELEKPIELIYNGIDSAAQEQGFNIIDEINGVLEDFKYKESVYDKYKNGANLYEVVSLSSVLTHLINKVDPISGRNNCFKQNIIDLSTDIIQRLIKVPPVEQRPKCLEYSKAAALKIETLFTKFSTQLDAEHKKLKSNEYARNYRERNKVKINERAKIKNKKYYQANKVKIAEDAKIYREANREKVNAIARKSYQKRKEEDFMTILEKRAYNKEYAKKNKEKIAKRAAENYQKKKEAAFKKLVKL